MAQTLKFKKLWKKNPFPSQFKAFERDAEKLPKREAAFTQRRAKSIMRKAPQRPRSRFGNLQPYSERIRKKRWAKYERTHFWRKGLYSRPGHPPFWHGDKNFSLKKIEFHTTQPKLSHAKGGKTYAYVVGPIYAPSKNRKPVPGLHEYGGSVRLASRNKGRVTRFEDRGMPMFRRAQGRLRYPPRPYMRPAAKEARESSQRKSPNSLKKLTKLGKWTGRRIY